MAEWLGQCRIRTVAMQSTGVYWIAVYDILEQAGFEVYLVNARDTKNLPGRKSDVQESQWLMKLHTYGLLRNSFRPSQEIRRMRTYWRQRNDLVRSAGRHVQRMQKALTQMNIQLANVLSDVSGMTGQAIIKAILGGERDPHKLAALRDLRVKASEEQIAQSLEGNWQPEGANAYGITNSIPSWILLKNLHVLTANRDKLTVLLGPPRNHNSVENQCRRRTRTPMGHPGQGSVPNHLCWPRGGRFRFCIWAPKNHLKCSHVTLITYSVASLEYLSDSLARRGVVPSVTILSEE